MPDHSTLAVVHYDRHHASLKDFAAKAAAASKSEDKSDKFLTFVPVQGHKDVAYIWFPHSSHAELEPGGHASALTASMGHEEATKLAVSAKGAVKGLGSVLMNRTASGHRQAGKVPAYVVTYAVKLDPGKAEDFKDAAKAFVEANKKSDHPVPFGVHRPADMTSGQRLIVLGLDSLGELNEDGILSHGRLTSHLGEATAKKMGEKLRRSLKGAHRQVLRYVPEYSHA